MNFDNNALIHDRKCFERDTLMERLEQLKFNWDNIDMQRVRKSFLVRANSEAKMIDLIAES